MKKTTHIQMLFAIAVISLPQSSYGQGGDKAGGGGDLLKCTDNGVTKYWLLDMREGYEKGEKISAGPASMNIYEKINFIKNQYSVMDETRATDYAVEAVRIAQDLEALDAGRPAPHGLATYLDIIRPGTSLADLNDEDEVSVYQNCEQENGRNKKYQLAYQGYFTEETNAFYVFDRKRWHWLDGDEDQKVATLYHEVIYRDFRSKGHYVSRSARRLNRYAMSGEIATMPMNTYIDFLAKKNVGSMILDRNFSIQALDPNVTLTVDGEVQEIIGGYIFKTRPEKDQGIAVTVYNPTFHARKLKSTFIALQNMINIKTTTTGAERLEVTPNASGGYGRFFGGTLSRLANGTYEIRGLRKNDDLGELTLLVDADGMILSRSETGAWMGDLSIETYSRAVDLVTCVREVVEKKRGGLLAVERSVAWLKGLIPLLYTQDVPGISTFINQCQGFKEGNARKRSVKREQMLAQLVKLLPELKINKALETAVYGPMNPALTLDKTVRDLLMGIIRPNALICDQGFGIDVMAGLAVAGRVGLRELACTLTNGRRIVYGGLVLGVGGGLGAAVRITKLDPSKEKIWKAGKAGLIDGDLLSERLILGPVNVVSLDLNGEQMKYSKLLHVGVYWGGDSSVALLPRLFRLKDDFSSIIHKLSRTNVAPINNH